MYRNGIIALLALGLAVSSGVSQVDAFIFSAQTPIPGVIKRGIEQDVLEFGRTPPAETIAAAATITADACGGLKQITAAGIVTTNTTDTFSTPGAANRGCIMQVCNVGANAITLDANANFAGAAAGNVAVGAGDCVSVGSNGTIWRQLAPLIDN